MITFDYLTLKAFLKENSDFLTNARIQKIQAPSRKDLIVVLRNNGETKKLYLNIDAQLYHLCFMSKGNEEKRYLQIPKQPTMFCMLLRKYLENSKIAKVNIPDYERIFEIFIETYNELGDKIYLCLAVELMGKYSNIVLYNYDTNLIIGCCHNVGAEKSRHREMAGLLPYVYPEKQKKLDILNYNGEIANLNDTFLGFSRAMEQQLEGKTLSEIQNYVKLEGINPAISEDFEEYTLYKELIENSIAKSSVNSMIDDYFAHHQSRILNQSLKQKLKAIVNPKYKKALGSMDKISKQLLREEKADTYRLYGDLLMANLYNLRDFSKTATLTNWEDNSQISIPLDDTKSIKDNANKYYKLYNKAKTSSEKLHELEEKLIKEIEYYEDLIFTIESAENTSTLKEIEDEIKEIKTPENKCSIKELSFNNRTIYVGQNNRQNDLIVSKISTKDDLWFHAKDCTGSHVLLKNPNKEEISDEEILFCAKLAKQYSKAKDSPKAGVIYTFRKNLKKPPASNLGYVTYKNETEILVD